MRIIRAVWCVLVAGLIATACSGSEASVASPGPAPFDAVLIELFGTSDTDAYLATAERTATDLVKTCMNDAGFEFELSPVADELDAPDPTSIDDARELGFGIVADYRYQISELTVETAFGGDPNLAYLSTLTAADIQRFLVTLDGIEPEPGQLKQDTGCNGAASDAAYGDWVRFSATLPNYTAIGEERDTHPDWLATRLEWRDCMVERGFDYAEPDVIQTNVIIRMRDAVNEAYPQGQPPLVQVQGEFVIDPVVDALLDDLQQFEQDAAVANVECTGPLADRFAAVEESVQQGFVDRNQQPIDELLSFTP